jgi:hypothetical protein
MMFDGSAWTTIRAGPEFEDFKYSDLTVDQEGRVWALDGYSLAMYDGSQLIQLAQSGGGIFAIDSQGQAWINAEGGAYALKNGKKTRYTEGQLPSDFVNRIVVDAHDRVWFGTMRGVTILDGGVWTTYHMSNSGLQDDEIDRIVVTGAGPNLPPPLEKPYGAISGRILQANGAPLANAVVEVCTQELETYYLGETPCSAQPFIGRAQTGANGKFLLENLPAGYYYLTMDQDGNWVELRVTYGIGGKSVLVRPGETNDLGDIQLGS